LANIIQVILAEFADTVVKLSGKQWFRLFGLLGELGCVLDEVGHALLLPLELMQ